MGESGERVAGIRHARGPNSYLPAQWMVYAKVKDVSESAREAQELGGKNLDGPRSVGTSHFCAIQDPAGADLALVGEA